MTDIVSNTTSPALGFRGLCSSMHFFELEGKIIISNYSVKIRYSKDQEQNWIDSIPDCPHAGHP